MVVAPAPLTGHVSLIKKAGSRKFKRVSSPITEADFSSTFLVMVKEGSWRIKC